MPWKERADIHVMDAKRCADDAHCRLVWPSSHHDGFIRDGVIGDLRAARSSLDKAIEILEKEIIP